MLFDCWKLGHVRMQLTNPLLENGLNCRSLERVWLFKRFICLKKKFFWVVFVVKARRCHLVYVSNGIWGGPVWPTLLGQGRMSARWDEDKHARGRATWNKHVQRGSKTCTVGCRRGPRERRMSRRRRGGTRPSRARRNKKDCALFHSPIPSDRIIFFLSSNVSFVSKKNSWSKRCLPSDRIMLFWASEVFLVG